MTITKKRIIDYYDNCQVDYQLLWHLNKNLALHYGFWDQTTKNLPQALERENQILAQKAKIKATDLVLDAGCGVGGSSIYLAKKYGCKVIGITLSQKQVKQAKLNAQKAGVKNLVNFYKKDYLKTGFKSESFDLVWALESFCVTDQKAQFLTEASRVLKKGGRLIIADYYLTKTEEKYQDSEWVVLKNWLEGWAINPLISTKSFLVALEKNNLSQISIKNITQNILPSSKRLYLYSFPGLFFGRILMFLKLRSQIQMGNITGTYYQYQALKRGIVAVFNSLC